MKAIPRAVMSNEYGTKLVLFDAEQNANILLHGTAKHGMQSQDSKRADDPLTYYHRSGPIGDVFAAYPAADAEAQVAIIGLGAGSMAAYAKPRHHFTFYEIDPNVADIARNPACFTFLSRCTSPYDVVIGDAQQTLTQSPDAHYDLIVLDAFDGDTIPENLRSRSTVDFYLRKLAETGLLVFHVSNVHVDLVPILAAMADDIGLICLTCADLAVNDQDRSMGKLPSIYVAMARNADHISQLAGNPRWKQTTRTR